MIEHDTPMSVLDPPMWPKTGIGGRVLIDGTEKWEQEGNAPASRRQSLINHELSPFWQAIDARGLSAYLDLDLSRWAR